MSRVYCDDYKYQLKIDEKCFYYCSNLEEVLFSETTASIGYRAFDYTSLEILELPEGLRFFGEDFISNPEPKPGLCVMKNLKSLKVSFVKQLMKNIQLVEENTQLLN